MKSTTIPTASAVILSSFSFREVDARSTISISMQFTTLAKISADSSLVIPADSWAATRISLAFSRSNSSSGISPGSSTTSGNRPGAPKVRIFAKVVANSGALASGDTRTAMSVSRSFFFFMNTDLIPLRFFFCGSTGAGFGASSRSVSFSYSNIKSDIVSPAELPFASLVSATSFSTSPIKSLNCRCRSSSAAADFSRIVLKA
mmetsp:Transcript_27179/g.50960  ORF Transcript_27179/g.50960 Transcript_27179/m.50960 type:complete len:203 (+) Transcript_27179:164-772(+)